MHHREVKATRLICSASPRSAASREPLGAAGASSCARELRTRAGGRGDVPLLFPRCDVYVAALTLALSTQGARRFISARCVRQAAGAQDINDLACSASRRGCAAQRVGRRGAAKLRATAGTQGPFMLNRAPRGLPRPPARAKAARCRLCPATAPAGRTPIDEARRSPGAARARRTAIKWPSVDHSGPLISDAIRCEVLQSAAQGIAHAPIEQA